MTGPAGELRLTCHPEHADELIARARAAFPVVGEPRGPYPNRPRQRRGRRGEVDVDQDLAAGMVRIYLDLDDGPAPVGAQLEHDQGAGDLEGPAVGPSTRTGGPTPCTWP